MPGNILNADTGFPQFTGNETSEQKLDKVMNYLYMLLEQLRYTLNNLDADNFNDTGLKEIADGIARPLQTSFENELVKTNASIEGWSNEFGSQISSLVQFQKTVEDGTIESIASIRQKVDENAADISILARWRSETEGELESIIETTALIQARADENAADIELLAQFRAAVEDGTISSISSIKQTADANAAQIVQLNQWKGTASSSLVAVQSMASQNEAKITSLTNWKSTAEDDIEGLAETVAVIEQVADENGASISQIVQAVGEDGEVNAASIVAAVNSAGSSVKIDADHLDVDAIAIFKNTADGEGVTTINGDDIVLVADNYGDSISGITFYKWRYSDDTEDDHTLDSMFRIRTIDNESDDENYARYAAQIQTLSAYEDSTRYHVALKLISDGSMSMESDYAIYMYADTYMTLEAYDNVRIRANRSYSAFTGDNVSADDYIFCTNGIYMDGVRVVNPAYEFTATGIYYNGELVVATP